MPKPILRTFRNEILALKAVLQQTQELAKGPGSNKFLAYREDSFRASRRVGAIEGDSRSKKTMKSVTPL